MAINSIRIENFTVFKEMQIEFSPGINVFIGENGTGKTHLLKVLYAANTMFSSNYTHNINDLFGNNFQSGGLRFKINGDDSHPWKSVVSQNTIQQESYIHLEISEKKASVFIPAKEVLSMANITKVAEDYKKNLNLDVTITDIIKTAQNIVPDVVPELAVKIAPKIEELIEGNVFHNEKDNTFWIYKNNGDKFPFSSEAEGFKKLGLLWQLIMNKSINEHTILFWDEPEANMNRKLLPEVTDILLELSRNGVQIFLATHDYNLMKYFSIKKKADDQVTFISLYKTDDGVLSEAADDYDLLENNSIIDANIKLYDDDLEGVL